MTKREHSTKNGVDSSSNGTHGSQSNVKAAAGRGSRGGQTQAWTGRKHINEGDASGSNSYQNSTISPIPSEISLKDRALNGTFRNYRKELASVDNGGGGNVPSFAREPPTAPLAQVAPWASESSTLPATASLPPLRSFFDDSECAQLSPSYGPSTSRTGTNDTMESQWSQDERRPSVASSTTVGSQESGSKVSTGKGSYHKKLVSIFGEDFDARSSPQSSSTSIPTLGRENSNNSNRTRNNSVQTTYDGRPISPASSRPRTPLPVPSSDVVPWIFQDYKDIPQYGDAPVRQVPAGPDKQRYDHDSYSPAHHRFHFPGHKHSRSKEEHQKTSPRETSYGQPLRPSTSRDDSPAGNHPLKEFISSPITPMTSRTTLNIRSSSPTPSTTSSLSRDGLSGQRSPADGATAKRGIFDKFRRHKGGDKGQTEPAKNVSNEIRNLPDAPLPTPFKRGRDGSVATVDSGTTIRAPEINGSEASSHRKDSKARLLHPHGIFPTQKRGHEKEKEADKARNGSTESESLWSLDTNLNNMEGIISSKGPLTPPTSGIWTGSALEDGVRREPWEVSATTGPGAWDAPDSWAVRKAEDMARVEMDEKNVPPKVEDRGIPYCMRVFRVDSTFATLSTSINTPVSEVMQLVGKKSFMVDEINNYQIVMKKHDLQRQLGLNERPIAIQKNLLEQAGYEEADRIEDIGREDNSYLCRFTFVPAKLAGYYSLEKDPEIEKLQKFSHVDLSGKSLVTIPIKLYKKAAEITALNLSRNLAIDIPKDFIQSCGSLRELKFMSNEATTLPASIGLAARLVTLDVSNNRLEQLEHAELDKLQKLASIKIANNKLKHLPNTFGQFKMLRSLNISSNYLSVFPDFLCDLRSLVDLDISFNAIKELPKIGQLKTLERLWATNNVLEGVLPDSFQDLESLREIDIRFNGLTSIDVIAKLPRLEQLMAGHNAISAFEGSFSRMRILHLDHNPITRFDVKTPLPTLTALNLASAKISQLNDSFFKMVHNLNKLNLDKNHFVALAPQIGELRKLEHLSIAKNPLSSIPCSIGNLQELKYLDVRECNLKKLPSEIWSCIRMHTLNVSSNLLESFPKPPPTPGTSQPDIPSSGSDSPPNQPAAPGAEALGKIEEAGHRRPSQGSGGLLSVGPSPAGSTRQNSIVSVYGPGGRKASVISRTPTDPPIPPVTRKDSSIAISRLATSFAGSLRNLYIADNRLNDDVFSEITLLPELRVLNLSYNELVDIPSRSLRRWQHLQELYLSGNTLTSLPYDDLEEIRSLRVLHLNSNRFQVLPAELGKVEKLTILDIGSNSLKYNISNWPYDWNWNWNRNLKYLNFSGNKRLEIKPNLSSAASAGREETDLTNFNLLDHLRILGLMDVTLTIPSVPDETEDRRIRTSGSVAGNLPYGMADSLGRCEHLSIIDMVIPRFRGHDTELLMGMFDGSTQSTGGSKVAKYLHENFSSFFTEELKKIKIPSETPHDALRRTFLGLNKDLATAATQIPEERDFGRHRMIKGSVTSPAISADDLRSGSCATVIYLNEMDLYVANVGDVQAMLMHSDGGFRILTKKHDPALQSERERIREAGGYVSRHGRLNDELEVSRAFGYIHMMPAVMAAPHITKVTLKEQDEIVLIASKELWDYVTPDLAVDVARSDRGDLMRASQKLRDLAMAFGCTSKIMVMAIGVSDLKRKDRIRHRGPSLSMGPSQLQDDQLFPIKRGKRPRDGPDDSTLARLDQEVDAPTGDLSIVFTDIKSSTLLWETYPIAMRSAIKIHNNIMRRQLRIIGGYEVKTEGDAFMVSFPTATSALLWCFSVQTHLLLAPWPQEILLSKQGEEKKDADGNVIFRGLSVRMSIHWGRPVCEPDPITSRMDYFGPMVNRTARIQGEADGGQIAVSSDFIGEIERTLETYGESDRSSSVGSDDTLSDDVRGQAIRRELRSLSSQGFEVKELGERRLKGLENPEHIYLMYPHTLAGRLAVLQRLAEEEAKQASDSPATLPKDSKLLQIDMQAAWDLWNLAMRLERICSIMENPETQHQPLSEQAMLEKMKNRGGDISDQTVTALLESQVGRIELCVNTLQLRNMLRPFGSEGGMLGTTAPIEELFTELKELLLKQQKVLRDIETDRDRRLVQPGPGVRTGEGSRTRSTPSPRPSSRASTIRKPQPPQDGPPI